MLNFSDIGKIAEKNSTLAILSSVFLLAPGIAVIFFFNKPLFVYIDTFKLILLGITFVTPFVSIFWLFFGIYVFNEPNQTFTHFLSVVVSTLVCNIFIFLFLGLSYLFSWSFKTFLFTLFFVTILFVSILIIAVHSNKKLQTEKFA